MTLPRGMPGFRGLSHLSPAGDARMVDVSAKAETVREAVARVTVAMKPATLAAARAGQLAKGDVYGVARTAGILAAKRTPTLIPLCHPLRITGVDVSFTDDTRRSTITVEARVRTVDKTGVEMEALTAAAVAGSPSTTWSRRWTGAWCSPTCASSRSREASPGPGAAGPTPCRGGSRSEDGARLFGRVAPLRLRPPSTRFAWSGWDSPGG